MLKVLLVEDDPMIISIVTYYLEQEGKYHQGNVPQSL